MTKITAASGRGLPLRGNDIDTDRIIPARYLRSITFEGMEQHLFEDDRKTVAHPVDDPRFAGSAILIVNSNFGCGSSREHAPQAIYRWGIKAVIGESFAEIFFGNSMMIGMPCVTASSADVKALQDLVERNPGTEIRIDLRVRHVRRRRFPLCAVAARQRARRVRYRCVGHDRPSPRSLRRGQRSSRRSPVRRGFLIFSLVTSN